MGYDQKVIIWCLWNEGIDALEIIHRFQTQFGEHAYKFLMFRFWIAEVRFGRQNLRDKIRTGRPSLDDLDAKILAILDKSPFESARSIAEILRIVHSTVLLHLHDSISFRSFNLYWDPLPLTHDLCAKRKEYTKAMLPFLHAAERNIWHYLVAGDESCFFLNISSSRM
jgi:hypothetical protein